MTRENFEKRKELHEKLRYIDDLKDIIKSSLNRNGYNNNRRVLAAVYVHREASFKFNNFDIINYNILEDDIAQSILKLLDEKYNEVKKEYEQYMKEDSE